MLKRRVSHRLLRWVVDLLGVSLLKKLRRTIAINRIKQRQFRTFALFDQVSVAVPALDRASTDDKRIFGRVIEINPKYNSYQILIKYEVLDRNYPTSELNSLPSQFDLGIPNPPSTAAVTLHYCAAQESISEKVSVHCNCLHQKT